MSHLAFCARISKSLKSISPVYQFLAANKDRFEHDVIGPLCTTLSVRDKESAAMIETALGKDKMIFLVQSDRDYNTFAKIQSPPGHPLKPATCVRWLDSQVQPSIIDGVAAGKLAEYGIDGTILDRSADYLQMMKASDVNDYLQNELDNMLLEAFYNHNNCPDGMCGWQDR